MYSFVDFGRSISRDALHDPQQPVALFNLYAVGECKL